MGEILYYSSFLVAFIMSVFVNRIISFKFYISKKNALIYSIVGFFAGLLGALLMGFIKDGFFRLISEDYVKTSYVCIFGAIVFSPVFLIWYFNYVGQKKSKGFDFSSLEMYLVLAFGKLGCAFSGCCYGIPVKWGIYNENADCNVLPVQIFEGISTLIIFSVLLIYIFKRKKTVDGNVYALGLIMYSAVRFFWEFFRFYSENDIEGNLIFGLSVWQVFAVITFTAGIILMIFNIRKSY